MLSVSETPYAQPDCVNLVSANNSSVVKAECGQIQVVVVRDINVVLVVSYHAAPVIALTCW